MKRLTLLLAGVLLLAGCNSSKPGKTKMAFMPKLVGIPYFNACKRGAEEAAKELNIDLVYNGPTKTDVNKQIDLIKQWVASGEFDSLCVACNEPARRARSRSPASPRRRTCATT